MMTEWLKDSFDIVMENELMMTLDIAVVVSYIKLHVKIKHSNKYLHLAETNLSIGSSLMMIWGSATYEVSRLNGHYKDLYENLEVRP